MGAVLGFAMASGFATAANATTYYLHDVTFDDGTSASGYFSTSVYGYIDSFDITTVDGAIAGYHYVSGVINSSYNPGDSSATFNRPSYIGYLSLTTTSPINSLTSGAFTLAGAECDTYGPPCPAGHGRSLLSGSLSLTPAPESATWGLMILGFGAIGFALRRTRASIAFAPAR